MEPPLPPISLKKIRYEPFKGRVLFDTTHCEYFKQNVHMCDARKRAWARLLAKVYQIDPMVCPRCRAKMKVIAVIEDLDEIKRILRHAPRETCVCFPAHIILKPHGLIPLPARRHQMAADGPDIESVTLDR